ncbi:tryptophan aminotransferase-related protein 4-like [Pyrus ussuriensis x Pyrus communis]|uniref:Tryptophan aminotransferase-related protein 4-like n=1 Tax=Pyrus ussuriensis x Pyrus communis TaxID=2448454 RepID=A0A5N5H4L0_9ROSA|nr:tryptophan aminotransferase-related protein 4-like [Pyrus ussuriensis x Pyrus communis]
MAPKAKSIYVASFSIAVNLLFCLCAFKLYVEGEWKLSWSRRAAEEAEHVAAIPCSGHGRAYLDGLILDGKEPVCECNSCYGGPDCSLFVTGCAANADGGDPFFLEPFWMQHAAKSAIAVAGWHRMSYSYPDKSSMSAELENHIRRVHAIVGNAVTEGRYIVFGAGSTHLLNAALYALSSDNFNSSPASVLVSVPYYKLYQTQAEFFRSLDFKFEGDAALFQNISDDTANVIEYVTSPNNPDGQLKKAMFQGPNAKAIYDRVYYWPHFTAIPAPADDDLMIFSISKFTGHAGTRFGWAVVKDESVYQRMETYIQLSSFGVSRDTQLRALKLMNVVLETRAKEIFEFGFDNLKKRWEKLSSTLRLSNRFSLQKIAPQYCTYFQKIRVPSPAYAWVKCEREEDKDCYGVLQQEANVYGRRGSLFGAEDRYVRLALIRSEDDFDILLQRLNHLVLAERNSKIIISSQVGGQYVS